LKKRILKYFSLSVAVSLILLFCFGEKSKRNPNYGQIFYELGMKCVEKCPLNKQLKYFRKAVYHKPDLEGAYYQLGLVYEKSGDGEMAIDSFKKATQLNPHYSEPHFKVGLDYFRKNELETALNYFHQALKYRSNYAELNYYMAKTYDLIHDDSKALWHYLRASSIEKNYFDAYVRAGILSHRLGYNGWAVEQVEKLRELDQNILADQLEEAIGFEKN